MSWQLMSDHYYFGAMMLASGYVDALVGGFNRPYTRAVKPILEAVGVASNQTLAGVYMIVHESKIFFFSDCTINIDPSAEQLAEIAISTAETASKYVNTPVRVALLNYSSFGSSTHPMALKVKKAVGILRVKAPHLEVDGEMQVDIALDSELRQEEAPFCSLTGDANVLIFPDLASANIGYKLLTKIASATPTGPILVGVNKPANIVQRGASVSEIVNMVYVSAHQIIS
ncbi:MAG: phosphate acyltransferase [Bdellovibrionota bacterium]